MAKTRAQRKAERRRREARQAREAKQERQDESKAQHDTQVPETADVLEAELAEQGVDIDALREADSQKGAPVAEPQVDETPEAPAPSRADVGAPEKTEDKISRRAAKREEREKRQRAKESQKRREKQPEQVERQRGAVVGFIVSCWAELKRVQWPDRETLIQASAVTLIFIAITSAYLGALDAVFNWIVQRIL